MKYLLKLIYPVLCLSISASPIEIELPKPYQNDVLNQNAETKPTVENFTITQRKIISSFNQNSLSPELMSHLEAQMPNSIRSILNILKKEQLHDYWPHFLLLVGSPGVGKTTYAKFIAQYMDVHYLFFSATAFADEYQNSGAQNIDRIFSEIMEAAQGISLVIILDEINALCDKGSRKHLVDKGTSMALWMWLDRLKDYKNVIVIGTTNDVSKCHEQIISRANNIISIEHVPDQQVVLDILTFYLQPFTNRLNDNELYKFAKYIKSLTPRAIEQIVMKAVHLAALRESTISVEQKDLWNSYKDYRQSQALYKNADARFKSAIKKWSKYGLPILTTISVVLTIIMWWPQLKLMFSQLELGNKTFELTKESVSTANKALAIAIENKDIAQKGAEVSKATVLLQASQNYNNMACNVRPSGDSARLAYIYFERSKALLAQAKQIFINAGLSRELVNAL